MINKTILEKVFWYALENNPTEEELLAYSTEITWYRAEYITAWFKWFYQALFEIYIIEEPTYESMTENFSKFSNPEKLMELVDPYFLENPVTEVKYNYETKEYRIRELQEDISDLENKIELLNQEPDIIEIENPNKQELPILENEKIELQKQLDLLNN